MCSALRLLPFWLCLSYSLSTTWCLMDEAEKIIKQEELQEKIEAFMETDVRPFVQQDGGDIEVIGFNIDTGIVRVQMQGACSTCPSSIMTLQFGVERRLKEVFPEVKGLEASGLINFDELD